MQVKLKVQSGTYAGREISVSTDKFLVGRSDSCQLRPKSESVSRKHCILVQKDNRLLVQDLKSRNGTFVNGERLPTDRAKVIKEGDILQIGKLEFEVIIEHGLQAAKKPVVKDVADAAARTASTDSRYEDVDIDTWLGEADAVDRVRRLSDPETRQFRVDQIQQDESSKEDSQDMSVADESESKFKRPDRSGPKKLPASAKAAMTENSRDAAQDALKRHFGGR